ncbi:serine/threonine-protein kinase fray2-like [Ostrea edulis]|uniref:serine/threonine-protein kinase fray2-like n=1 Tax=Ostrea edulis TaxID=37623 RepID=UPI0024AF6C13|nr:serine/threonine-protein kinase fray2-like [Ostrea edulis]
MYTLLAIVICCVSGLNAEQCYTSSGGVYSAGSIYRNLQYCAFGCCGPGLNRYCCPIIGPVIGICLGALTFIVILIIIIVCCRRYAEKQAKRRADLKLHIGPTLASRYDPPRDDAESNHVTSKQDYQVRSHSDRHASSHHMSDEHLDDLDYRPKRKRGANYPRSYSRDDARLVSKKDSYRNEKRSSRARDPHTYENRREYHSDDGLRHDHRDSYRGRHQHRDDRERERRHSRSRERYIDRSYDGDDYSDEERNTRSSHRRSRYSDPPPYRERSRDFDRYDRPSQRKSRSRDRDYYDR